MKKLKLYRGIAVPTTESDAVVDGIKRQGLHFSDQQYYGKFIWKDLKPNLKELFDKPDLITEDTRPATVRVETARGWHLEPIEGEQGVCFADKGTAERYALVTNRTKEKDESILISAEVEINDVVIDGRDFLYTVFGNLNTDNSTARHRAERVLVAAYGSGIRRYIEKYLDGDAMKRKVDSIAICDLVVNDLEIIEHHFNSKLVLEGRFRTIFKSSFMVKMPLSTGHIVAVERISEATHHLVPIVNVYNIVSDLQAR